MSTNLCPNCGHQWDTEKVFTEIDIKKMDRETYEQNREQILKQLSEGKIR